MDLDLQRKHAYQTYYYYIISTLNFKTLFFQLEVEIRSTAFPYEIDTKDPGIKSTNQCGKVPNIFGFHELFLPYIWDFLNQ